MRQQISGRGMPAAKPVPNARRREFKTGLARQMRKHPTDAERRLWALLRGRAGLRFRRQQPIGPYIADFFCSTAKLIIELDGGRHGQDCNVARDTARTHWLEARGYRVLRFGNHEVLKDPQDIADRVWLAVAALRSLPEPPSAVRPSLKGRVD